VDVVRGFEASLKWKVHLDCTLAHPCFTPVCDKRILRLPDAQNVDFGGRSYFIHCPGEPMESVCLEPMLLILKTIVIFSFA
jgi:hypothetical protein